MNKPGQSFDQGFACAVSCIVKGHGESTETREALESGGFLSVKIAKERGIEQYDLDILTPLLNEIEHKHKKRARA